MNPYLRMLGYLRRYQPRIAATLACMLVLALTTAAYAFMVGPLLAFLVTGDYRAALSPSLRTFLPDFDPSTVDRRSVLLALPILLVGVSIVKGAAYAGQFFLMGTIGQNVVADLRKDLFSKLVSLSPSFYARRQTGDLYSRLSLDVSYVENAIVWALSSYIRDSLQVIVLLSQAFILDWRLSIIAFGAFPLTVLPVIRFARRLKRITSQSNEAMGEIIQRTSETVGGIRVVQAFGMERAEVKRFDNAVERYLKVMRRSLLVRALSTPTMEIIAVAGIGAAIAYAGTTVGTGGLDGRVFMSFVATVLLMYQPAKTLGRVGNFMVQGMAGAERIFEILDAPNEIVDSPIARDVEPIRKGLHFEAVSFRYQSAQPDHVAKWVLREVDLQIARGEVVAIVGPSGSGKTTIANLVPRFFDVTEGRVSIDGVDVREMTLQSLRGQLSVVTQETLLFNESIAVNIAYGRPGASIAEIEAAAKAADAHEFIRALPKGYDTVIGERGVMLSGGQRQRLAIARAVLKDAPILILDEATSALDTKSEAEVQSALDRLMKDRTVLVIAHRLSTVRNADRIVVLVDGHIAEMGTHQELLAKRGEYARMIAVQSVAAESLAG
jgi:subfamily B ATP-binding cassette protein MsbA